MTGVQTCALPICLVAQIPGGRVATFSGLGGAIDVPARHVAYIVSRLDASARASLPLHRLVSDSGALQKKFMTEHTAALTTEGVVVMRGAVTQLAEFKFDFAHDSIRAARVERTTRPPERRPGAGGAPSLAAMPGLGPVSVGWLKAVGIDSGEALRKANAFAVYAKVKASRSRVSVNFLYALLGAQENVDWRTIARERRTEILMRLDDEGFA